jgi:ribose/xylose/arabinose/galactoside ABC-type transport system permease subunit
LGAVAGALKVRLKVDDVVTTLLLNFIMLHIVTALLEGPWRDASGYPNSPVGAFRGSSRIIPVPVDSPILRAIWRAFWRFSRCAFACGEMLTRHDAGLPHPRRSATTRRTRISRAWSRGGRFVIAR